MVDALLRLPQLHRRWRTSTSVAELLARVSDDAVACLDVERAVVLVIGEGRLTASEVGSLRHPGSDAWRRDVQRHAVRLAPSSVEAEAVRRGGARRADGDRPGELLERLGLRCAVLATISPEEHALALLVCDRPLDRPVLDEDLALVEAFCAAAATSIELVAMRERAQDLAEELRQHAGLTRALAGELLNAPVSLRHERTPAALFGAVDGPGSGEAPAEHLSAQETRIADLLLEGKTNREIAEVLVLSPETVKSHVARLLRKLGATNRVEAAAQYARLRGR